MCSAKPLLVFIAFSRYTYYYDYLCPACNFFFLNILVGTQTVLFISINYTIISESRFLDFIENLRLN